MANTAVAVPDPGSSSQCSHMLQTIYLRTLHMQGTPQRFVVMAGSAHLAVNTKQEAGSFATRDSQSVSEVGDPGGMHRIGMSTGPDDSGRSSVDVSMHGDLVMNQTSYILSCISKTETRLAVTRVIDIRTCGPNTKVNSGPEATTDGLKCSGIKIEVCTVGIFLLCRPRKENGHGSTYLSEHGRSRPSRQTLSMEIGNVSVSDTFVTG